eukprot:11193382-Lingulodinium_polyedra.AAC.1
MPPTRGRRRPTSCRRKAPRSPGKRQSHWCRSDNTSTNGRPAPKRPRRASASSMLRATAPRRRP